METTRSKNHGRNLRRARDLPIRDGNIQPETLAYEEAKARDLPIRDGNTAAGSRSPPSIVARDLPIRDGNTVISLIRATGGTGPRPSYKGWKRALQSSSGSPSHRPRPSYKGWKQECRPNVLLRLLYARDLPIRDGNAAVDIKQRTKGESPRPSYKGWKHVITPARSNRGTPPATFL